MEPTTEERAKLREMDVDFDKYCLWFMKCISNRVYELTNMEDMWKMIMDELPNAFRQKVHENDQAAGPNP